MTIVGRYPADGAGLDCGAEASETCGVPRDAPLELRFDRFLDPTTATRQSVEIYTRYPDLGVFLTVDYDLVERVVSYRPRGGWEAGALYTVVVPIATGDGEYGFRAFDGAPLGPRDGGNEIFTFRASTASTEEPPPSAPTCADIIDIFAAAGCSSSACHGGDQPPGGLDLRDGDGLERTALRRVARETENGTEVGRPLVDPARFGTRMPIIDPGNAPNSYLLYKLLSKPENYRGGDCRTVHRAPLDGLCPAPEPAELAALRGHFVRLDPMPPGERALPSIDALRAIARFIDDGAPLDDCR